MSDTKTVPIVCIDVQERNGTNRPVFAPSYEKPLIDAIWSPYADIVVRGLPSPGGRPWPTPTIEVTQEAERARLSAKYERHPTTKEPLFETIYGFGRFEAAFAEAVAGDKPAKKVKKAAKDETPDPLTAIDGVGASLACDLRTRYGVETVEDVADLTAEDLAAVGGIGAASAEKILASAAHLALTE